MGAGGFLSDAFAELGDRMIGGFKGLFEKDAAYGMARSGRALLDKYPEGAALRDYLQNTVDKEVRVTGQQLLQQRKPPPGTPLPQAIAMLRDIQKQAVLDTHRAKLGKNNEVLIKGVATLTQKYGPAYGNAVADAISAWKHDVGGYWRQKKVTLGPGQTLALTDLDIRPTPEWVKPKDFEVNLRRRLSLMYTQTIAIPHLSQIMNSVLREGVFNTSKALSEWTAALVKHGDPSKAFQDLIDSGLLYDEWMHEAYVDIKDPGARLMSRIIDHPLFNWERRQQITMAGLAGKHHAIGAAAELAGGVRKSMNEFTLRRLGINVNDLAQRGYKLSPEDIKKAMYQAGSQSMFLRSPLETPWKWEESFGLRMATQYKHWAYRQNKFIFETLMDAYKHGGMMEAGKVLFVLGTLFPVAGYAVNTMQNLILGKGPENPFAEDKNFVSEYFSYMSHVAGWGILHSMFRTGARGYIEGHIGGPLASTADDFLTAGVKLGRGVEYQFWEDDPDRASSQYRQASRLLLKKLGIVGKVGAEFIPRDNI